MRRGELLGACLDAFRDRHHVEAVRHLQHGVDHRGRLAVIRADPVDERFIDLDDIGGKLPFLNCGAGRHD